ncbi:fungal-specific transcription factor domain-containing protein [Dactylonectria macrodidyma]|uniref:Fungal-specific transcription factor domain-containing protein n=1 Tax=Dactylonectria macrodidyma TaxID=307937 RepID=A0A9P9ITX2_9HYPO|nr:fungal-specific transcription factor domain-containing protein [Dactylonectria macrodidyma]
MEEQTTSLVQSEQPERFQVSTTPIGQQAIIRACDVCRKKKIRCDPTKQGCLQCTKFGTYCHFTPISTRRKPRRPAGYKYIAQLEERLEKMEVLLERALQGTAATANSSSNESLQQVGGFVLREGYNAQFGPNTGNSEAVALIPATARQELNLIGNNLEMTLSSSTWQREDNEMTENTLVLHETSHPQLPTSPHPKAKSVIESYSFSFHELPSKSVALELVEESFNSFNSFYPIFDKEDFLKNLHDEYSNTSPNNPSWWACVNVVLSLAHRYRAMRTLEIACENIRAYNYLQNALAVVSELCTLHDNLPALQALVGMATILQGTVNPHISSVITATAVRLAQGMGLHTKSPNPNLSEKDIEQGRRVFWIAYFLDKDISLRLGQPFVQGDDDMEVELPTENLTRISFYDGRLCAVDFLRSRVGLAIIQGQIYKHLYSVQATRQSNAQRAAATQELNLMLACWKSGIPIDFDDDPVTPPLTAEFIHILVLRFTYVNCLALIDRHVSPREQFLGGVNPNAQCEFIDSESICVIESRKTIRLIQFTPHGDYACVWLLLHAFFSTATTLLYNLLRYPTSPHATSDIDMLEPFMKLLEILVSYKRRCSQSEEAKRMYQTCMDLRIQVIEAIRSLDL